MYLLGWFWFLDIWSLQKRSEVGNKGLFFDLVAEVRKKEVFLGMNSGLLFGLKMIFITFVLG